MGQETLRNPLRSSGHSRERSCTCVGRTLAGVSMYSMSSLFRLRKELDSLSVHVVAVALVQPVALIADMPSVAELTAVYMPVTRMLPVTLGAALGVVTDLAGAACELAAH